MLIPAALARLFVAFFFGQAGFNIYWAALPLYFASLGLDPTTIGIVLGMAGVAELGGALMVGPGIDRLGGRMLLLAGLGCYLLASVGYLWFTSLAALVVIRLIQGLGIAAVIPSTYSFVPHLVHVRRQTFAFASLGAGGNVAQALFPALGIALLDFSPNALFTVAAVCTGIGALIVLSVPPPRPSGRRFGLTFQRGWIMPLLVGILTICQWGVITAFLPLAAAEQGANPALMFTADAIAVLAARLPAGWIADRYGPLRLALVGVVMMALSPLTLLLPLTPAVLIAAGILNGGGAGLVFPPILAQLSQRSDESRRGTALSYFSVSFAVGMIVGSSGGGVLYTTLGFQGLLVVGALLCLCGLGVLLADAMAWRRPIRSPAAARYTPSQSS